ncbi:MAG: hypothetical protein AAF533_01060 [Acidobacteriota bacterium]
MIVVASPLRLSFLGGGTDYPSHFEQHGGCTLGTSIDRYVQITVSALSELVDHRYRVSYSRTELCSTIDEIEHPAVRECLRFLEVERPVEINAISDLPARTGLGSSSAFTVSLLHALHAFQGRMVSQEQLAHEAVLIERRLVGDRVGVQDQWTSALGGLLQLELSAGDRVLPRPVVVDAARQAALQERLLLFYTGQQRSSAEVLGEQVARTQAGENHDALLKLQQLAQWGVEVLARGPELSPFGELLEEAWQVKRGLSSTVTNDEIDAAHVAAREAGALGGKLLGAGGGGFLLEYVEPYNHEAVTRALSSLPRVPFSFENQGSRLVFFRPRPG